MTFDPLAHVIEDLNFFGCVELLNRLAYKLFNVHMKRAYRSVSQCRISALEKILSDVDMSVYNKNRSCTKYK